MVRQTSSIHSPFTHLVDSCLNVICTAALFSSILYPVPLILSTKKKQKKREILGFCLFALLLSVPLRLTGKTLPPTVSFPLPLHVCFYSGLVCPHFLCSCIYIYIHVFPFCLHLSPSGNLENHFNLFCNLLFIKITLSIIYTNIYL